MDAATPSRTIRDGPFAWQAKWALRRIAAGFAERTDKAQALAVYVALAWFASDGQDDVVEIEKGRIAERAGVSYRKCADVLSRFSALGLVSITKTTVPGTNEQGPNRYRLLGTECPTSGTECPRLGTDEEQGSVPTIIEPRTEEPLEQAKRTRRQAPARPMLADRWRDLPMQLDTPTFRAAWAEYEAYRRANRFRPLKPVSVKKQWAEMATWGVDAATEAINTTIRNTWQGIFLPDPKRTTNENTRPGANSRAYQNTSDYSGV